jgi:hypothetical protein
MKEDERDRRSRSTREVGDEGGSPGEIEIDDATVTGGSEATSTVASTARAEQEIRRDETGDGRRTPTTP